MAALGLTPDGASSDEQLTPDQLLALFGAVDRELVRTWGVLPEPFELLVVGGAAVALQWHPGRLTKDVDVVSEGLPEGLWQAAERVAEGWAGVQPDWLNDAAKIGALSRQVTANPTLLYGGGNLRIHGASARYVLAMKLVAGRQQDLDDLPPLLAAAEFEGYDEALGWLTRAHSHRQVPVAAQYILAGAWEGHASHPHLAVCPTPGVSWGWGIELRQPGRVPITGGATYPTQADGQAGGGFILEIVTNHHPIRFEEWAQGWEYESSVPGDNRVVVRPVAQVDGWLLRAYRPDGQTVARSPLYPTHQEADSAQRFLQRVSAATADPERRSALRQWAVPGCGCRSQGRSCHHYGERSAPPANPVSVVVRPHRESPQGWELAVRDADGSPLRVSDPYPSEDAAVGARDFALGVVNGEYPIRFEGWNPWEWQDAPGYVPPSVEDAAVTVRVVVPPPSVPDEWRLEARRSTGYVVVTSRPYPAYPSADGALDFVGSLAALAGDPQRTGRVKDTTQPDDRVCDCRTLRAACLHFGLDGPDNRGPDRDDRGPYLGL